jgi:hypothetical protein
MGGAYPVLLLFASRKRGDYVPSLVIRLLGNRLVAGAIFILYLALIFFYGIFIYDNLLERLVTISVGVFMIIVTWLMIRRGAFQPRLVIELRDEQRPGQASQLSVVANGQAIDIPVLLSYHGIPNQEIHPGDPLGELRSLHTVSLPIPDEIEHISQVKVWVHSVSPQADSAGIPADVQITTVSNEVMEQASLPNGLAVLPLPPGAQKVHIML